jgi:hypothetical protein
MKITCEECGRSLPTNQCKCPIQMDLQCGLAVTQGVNCGHTTKEEVAACTEAFKKAVDSGVFPDGFGPADVSTQAHKLLRFCDSQGWNGTEILLYLTTALGAHIGHFVKERDGIDIMLSKLPQLLRSEAHGYFDLNRKEQKRF